MTCRSNRRRDLKPWFGIALIGLAMASASTRVAAQSHRNRLYWADTGTNKIQRADLDGANVEDLVVFPGLNQEPAAIAIDQGGGKIYWIDVGTHSLQRADLDGSTVEVLIPGGIEEPADLVIDAMNGLLYWSDGDAVRRAFLDGSDIEDVMFFLPDRPSQIAVDPSNGKLYWVSTRDEGGTLTVKIRRANLDGTAVEDVVTNDLIFPSDLVLDAGAAWLYWSDIGAVGNGQIQRIRLDDFTTETLISELDMTEPWGLGLDESNERIYWSDNRGNALQGTIKSASLTDGSDIRSVVGIGLQFPTSIALDAVVPTGIDESSATIAAPRLSVPWPNPVDSRATFTVVLPVDAPVTIELMDILGRTVDRLFEGRIPGRTTYPINLDATRLPSGLYAIRATGPGFVITRSFVRVP